MSELDPEDAKLVTLARGAMGRAEAGSGAAVRDQDGRTYAGASVAVNIHSEAPGEGPDPGCNRRLFELAAIGVPQVVEDRPDLHRHFREGSEILVARTPAQLRSLTAEALQDRAWAEEVAAGARQRVLGEHTYMHRMQALLPTVPVPA